MTGEPSKRSSPRLPGCIFLGVGMLFCLVGATMAEQQRRRFKEWIEVPAQVMGQEIRTHDDSEGDTMYKPVLKLRFMADGMPPTGEGFLATDISTSSESWARDQLEAFPVGRQITVWANPAKLDEVFVLRQVSTFPYIFIFFPMIFVSAGLVMFLLPAGNVDKDSTPPNPVPFRVTILLWNIVGWVCAVHFFSQPDPWHAAGIALFACYLGIGIIPVIVMVKRALRSTG